MNKNFTYIQENIPGIWYDENFSFTFTISNCVSYTNKYLFPESGSQGKFWIKKEHDFYVLEIILFERECPISKMILIIEDFDNTTLKVRSLNNNKAILTKVA